MPRHAVGVALATPLSPHGAGVILALQPPSSIESTSEMRAGKSPASFRLPIFPRNILY
jgi:hypothetical protein